MAFLSIVIPLLIMKTVVCLSIDFSKLLNPPITSSLSFNLRIRPINEIVNVGDEQKDVDDIPVLNITGNNLNKDKELASTQHFQDTKTPWTNVYLTSTTDNFTSDNDFGIDFNVKYVQSRLMTARSCADTAFQLRNSGVLAFCLLDGSAMDGFPDEPSSPCDGVNATCNGDDGAIVHGSSLGYCHTFEKIAATAAGSFPVGKTDYGTDCKYIVYHPNCLTPNAPYTNWRYTGDVELGTNSSVVRKFQCKESYYKGVSEVISTSCDRQGVTTSSGQPCKPNPVGPSIELVPLVMNNDSPVGDFAIPDAGTTGPEPGQSILVVNSMFQFNGEDTNIDSLFAPRAVTTTLLPHFKCPPLTIDMDTKLKTHKKFWWSNNYCHYYSSDVEDVDKPTVRCKGTNYNDDTDGIMDMYAVDEFERDVTSGEIKSQECGTMCGMWVEDVVSKLDAFVDLDAEAAKTLTCYYYDSLETTLYYYNHEFFEWVDFYLGAETSA